ncbi:MAG: hypothetical protein U0Q12_23455, partial [Vicinamibacterales bacterium]
MKPKPRALDRAALLAIPFSLAVIAAGQRLEGGSFQSILQLTAAIIVFGGTFGAVLLSFSWQDIRTAGRSLRSVFYQE